MKLRKPRFSSKNLGYKYSGYLCRGFKSWEITTPSGKVYSILITIGRNGTNSIGYVRQGNEEIAVLSCASYRKCLDIIREREELAA